MTLLTSVSARSRLRDARTTHARAQRDSIACKAPLRLLGLGLLLSGSLSGCDVFDDNLEARVQGQQAIDPEPLECRTHDECTAIVGDAAACVKPEGRCVRLKSDQCPIVTGDLSSPDAVVLGSMFSLTGPQAATNLPRQQSAILAIEAINNFGGVPGMGAVKRPLVLVSCDEVADLDAAATHLVRELEVPAIIGPNVSQDVITVSNKYSVAGGTLLISPTAVASSIADLSDNDLTWIMVPSDEQRASLMIQQINEIESQLVAQEPERRVKLSVVHRSDALGTGTRVALNSLRLNGLTLAENVSPNVGDVKIEPYSPEGVGLDALVARQVEFAPDIIVMAGLAEAITQVMGPLEQQWKGQARPQYVLIDSLKVPELLTATSANDDLRKRVRGTGIVPTARSSSVYDAFRIDYQTRFPGSPSTISGMGPSHDAAYAVAYAMAATRDEPVSGASIAMGLTKLTGGVEIDIASTKILAAFQQLSAGKPIEAIGTFAPLHWDSRGAPVGGRVEVWCIASGTPTAVYQSSELTLDLKTNKLDGTYTPCE
jgi:ABC-type branched-subunit amino acid transport system substrate-binding protein